VIAFVLALAAQEVLAVTAGSPTTLEYEALRASLTYAGTVLTLPELHGGICGALCAGGPMAAERWLDDALADEDDKKVAPVHESLHELVRGSWQALGHTELGFEPLLPDDDSPLDEQVQALAAWCQGFLAGLGVSAPDVARRSTPKQNDADAPNGIEEILADFVEIGRAGLTDEDAAGGQADFALAELKEYTRVSVQIVFEELAARRAGAQREVH
jgi:uncharacterized protein